MKNKKTPKPEIIINNDSQSEIVKEAYKNYLKNPKNHAKKRIYVLSLRLEKYETLPSEWREAIKLEMEELSKPSFTDEELYGKNNDC